MKEQIKSAVDFLVASYGDIAAQAKTYILNPDDVAAALNEVDVDSAEYVVLSMLQSANPVVIVEKKTKTNADSTI